MKPALATLLLALPLAAQDTRHVTEPTIPPTCTTLPAALQATNNTLLDSDESKPDTARIQRALDSCPEGKAVQLKPTPTTNAFLVGPLELRAGVTLLIDKGVTLYASRNPRDFDTEPNTCGTSGPTTRPCRPLIGIHDAKNAAIMGEGTIDGRGDRTLLGRTTTWWQQSRAAEPKQLKYSAPRLIVANHADGLILYRIRLHNSPNFHVTVSNTDGFTAWGVHLLTPTVRGTDARNTDGIDPGSSQNITVTKSWIDNGDDNIAIKTGTHKMSVLDSHFYSGHGMSIGSETNTTDSDILVDTLILDHTTAGLRIKSNVQRGGPVRNVTYRHICLKDSPIPISITPFYTGQTTDGIVDLGMKGDKLPDYKGIHFEDVLSLTPGIVQVAGLDPAHRTEVSLNGVQIDGIQPNQARARNTAVTLGPKGANFTLTGEDVTTTPAPATQPRTFTCDGKFLPYQD